MERTIRRNTVAAVNWSQYVLAHSGGDLNKVIAKNVGVSEPNVSRWKTTGQTPRVDHVAAFARAYGRPVLEAFVAAGFLTADEAKVRPAAAPDFTRLTNDELLDLVRSRMSEKEAGGEHERSAPKTPAPDGGALDGPNEGRSESYDE